MSNQAHSRHIRDSDGLALEQITPQNACIAPAPTKHHSAPASAYKPISHRLAKLHQSQCCKAHHRQQCPELSPLEVTEPSCLCGTVSYARSGLTKKAEPPPTRGLDCNRNGNGGWLRRLVRRLVAHIKYKSRLGESKTTHTAVNHRKS